MTEHTTAQLKRAAKIFQWAAQNYENGGSWIVETYTTDEVIRDFKTLADAKRYCKLMHDREEDIRNA
jgi:hypothetical protein